MKDIEQFFQMPFNNILVGKPKQLKFCEDSLKRLIAAVDAGVPLSDLVQPTQTAYDNLAASLNETTTTYAQQQSKTLSVDNVLKTFRTTISKREATIRGLLDTDSPEYEEIFPQGLTQYTKINKSTAMMLMNQVYNGIKNHAATLGQPMVTEFNQFIADYTTARDQQELKKGSTDLSRDSWDTNVVIMYKQLTYNMLTIAREYIGQPEKAKTFFDQSILRLHKSTNGGAQPLSVQIPPLATTTPVMNFVASDTILLSNVSDSASIFWYGGNTIDESPKTTPNLLAAGEEIEIPAATIGKYLILLNKDTENTAEVEIMLV